MRGKPYSSITKDCCLKQRQKGLSLNELVQIFQIPKTTIHDWVSNYPLSVSAKANIQSRIRIGQQKGVENARKLSTKIIPQPDYWTPELVLIVAHFLFDGYSTTKKDGFVYCSRNLSQIKRMNKLIKKVFNIEPHCKTDKNGVTKSFYFSVLFYRYIYKKKQELLRILPKSSLKLKKAFLKAFYDDEGCITFNKNIKKVRGYQYSKQILKLVEQLLCDFDIDSQINKNCTEVTITGKENLIRFKNLINFSPQIYINHNRKNGIWKYKIDKKTILEKALKSYRRNYMVWPCCLIAKLKLFSF